MQGSHSADIVTTTIIVVVVVAATDTMVLAVLILFDLLLILLDSFPLGRHRPPPGCSALGPPACHRSRRSRPPSSYGSSWAWLLLAQPHPAPRTAPYSAPCADRGAAAFFKPTRLSAAAGGGGSTAEEAKRRAEPAGRGSSCYSLSSAALQAGALLLARFPLPLASPNKNLSVGRPAAAAERHLSVAVVALQQVCAPRPPPPRGPTAAWCAALPNAGTPCAAFRCRVLGGPTLALDLAGGCATPLLSAPLRGRPRKGLLPQPLLQSVPQRDLTGAPRVCVHRPVVCGAPLLLWGQQRCSGWPAKR